MESPRTIGVYVIRNMNTQKVYVGGSPWVERRLAQHKAMMRDGCHPNPRINGAVKYSGIDRFQFELLESVPDENNLAERELFWIKKLDAVNRGYNRTYNTEHFQRSKKQEPLPLSAQSGPYSPRYAEALPVQDRSIYSQAPPIVPRKYQVEIVHPQSASYCHEDKSERQAEIFPEEYLAPEDERRESLHTPPRSHRLFWGVIASALVGFWIVAGFPFSLP